MITGHGVPEDVVTGIYDFSRAFFDLPTEQKNEVGECGLVMGGLIHFALGKEALAATLGGEPIPELKETLDFGRLLSATAGSRYVGSHSATSSGDSQGRWRPTDCGVSTQS